MLIFFSFNILKAVVRLDKVYKEQNILEMRQFSVLMGNNFTTYLMVNILAKKHELADIIFN